jgi:hypothetical protein
MKPPKYPLVFIQWHDATTHNEWVDIADLKKEIGVLPTTTVGFLVKEDDEAYYIASTVHDDMTNAQITLPKGMVKSIVFGRFAEKRKKKSAT